MRNYFGKVKILPWLLGSLCGLLGETPISLGSQCLELCRGGFWIKHLTVWHTAKSGRSSSFFQNNHSKILTCIVILLLFSVLSHLPSFFFGLIKQLSSAMDANGPRMSGALYLMLFLPQDGLWNVISPPGWWEEGRKAPPEQPGSCTPSSYLQSLQVVGVNLGSKAASWATGNLKPEILPWKTTVDKPTRCLRMATVCHTD